jgi:hypothetical protein
MDNSNLKELVDNIRGQLPFYIQQGEYENFIKFVELYYDWLSQNGNVNDVASKITDYKDIDQTLDIFVDEFKNDLAAVFPDITKINHDEIKRHSVYSNIFNDTFLSNESIEYDSILGNGITSSFPLTYKHPSYYTNLDVNLKVVDLKVYANPSDVYIDESQINRGPTTDIESIFASLGTIDDPSFNDNWTLLTENDDYIIEDNRIKFYDNSTGNVKAPTDEVAILVVYRVSISDNITNTTQKKTEKKRFTNRKTFLKLMKEFYLSKGSEKSYEFLFRTFFNKDISLYYPKVNVLKTNDNTWVTNKSIRTIPSNNKVDTPVRVVGISSGATALVELWEEYIIQNVPVREYFVSSVRGEFENNEDVEIYMDNGVIIKETLYNCVTGFDIVQPGTNYPRNMYLNNFLVDNGDGVGFGARIENTTKGKVDRVEIITAGNDYITGEKVEIVGDGSLGSGAQGYIAGVDGTTEEHSLTWVQDELNVEYPQKYWPLSDYPNASYGEQYSRNEKLILENKDNNSSDVVLLTDFQELKNIREYVEYSNQLPNLRTNTYWESPVGIDPYITGTTPMHLVDGYVKFPTVASYFTGDNSTDDLTIDFWYIPETQANRTGTVSLFAINDPTGSLNKFVLWQTVNDEFRLTDRDTNSVTSPVLNIKYDEWNHVVIHSNLTTGTSIYLNGYLVYTTSFISHSYVDGNDVLVIGADADAGVDDTLTTEEVFDAWTRISHDSSGNFPAVESDLTAFNYNSTEDRIECSANLGRLTGFVSPKSFGNYTFSSTVTSADGDDDTIGLLFGFYKEPSGKEHTLTVLRSQGGTLGGGSYQIYYNHLQSDQQLLFNGNSLVTEEPSGTAGLHDGTGWSGIKTRIKIVREGNTFTIQTSQNSLSDVTDDDLDPATTVTINLDDYNFRHLFVGSSPYGYVNHSQGLATWTNINFIAEGVSELGDFSNSYYNSFRVTKAQRFNTYTDAAGYDRISGWNTDPIPKKILIDNVNKSTDPNSQYYWKVSAGKLQILTDATAESGLPLTWDDISGNDTFSDRFFSSDSTTSIFDLGISDAEDRFIIVTVSDQVGGNTIDTIQQRGVDYTVVGSDVVFTNPPPDSVNLDNNIRVEIYGLLTDTLIGSVDSLTLLNSNTFRILEPITIPDGYSITFSFNNLPRGGITRVDMVTGGSGYIKNPTAIVSEYTGVYKSTGSSAYLRPRGDNIGGIKEIAIVDDIVDTKWHGFGVGYTRAPVLDLTSIGDGNAIVNVEIGPLCERNGYYLSESGFLSNQNRIHDGYLWQDYSYVVRVNKIIDEWREIVKRVVHPAGLMMFGELAIETEVPENKIKGTYLYLLYEIIKNGDMSIKNMDGLGVWTLNEKVDSDGNVVQLNCPVNTKKLLPNGKVIKYNNRQVDYSTLTGVSDDTPNGQNVDVGRGRYCLLGFDMANAYKFSDVKYVGLNNYGMDTKDYEEFYTSHVIGRLFTIYDTSDKVITDNEWKYTPTYAQYKVIGVTIDTVLNTTLLAVEYVNDDTCDAEKINDISILPQNVVEFRWDKNYRGNVDKPNSYWVGAINEGANPRDEKFILKIMPKTVDGLGTTYKSLERFKFYFDTEYPWDELVRFRFSPEKEVLNSPYLDHGGYNDSLDPENVIKNNIQYHVVQSPDGTNVFGMVPTPQIGPTDGTDHEWPIESAKHVVDSYRTKYNMVLDSTVVLWPKILVVSEESRETAGQRVSGMTWRSVERMKFNWTPQSIDNELYQETTENVEQRYNERTNIGHESIMLKYSSEPTTISELINVQQN